MRLVLSLLALLVLLLGCGSKVTVLKEDRLIVDRHGRVVDIEEVEADKEYDPSVDEEALDVNVGVWKIGPIEPRDLTKIYFDNTQLREQHLRGNPLDLFVIETSPDDKIYVYVKYISKKTSRVTHKGGLDVEVDVGNDENLTNHIKDKLADGIIIKKGKKGKVAVIDLQSRLNHLSCNVSFRQEGSMREDDLDLGKGMPHKLKITGKYLEKDLKDEDVCFDRVVIQLPVDSNIGVSAQDRNNLFWVIKNFERVEETVERVNGSSDFDEGEEEDDANRDEGSFLSNLVNEAEIYLINAVVL